MIESDWIGSRELHGVLLEHVATLQASVAFFPIPPFFDPCFNFLAYESCWKSCLPKNARPLDKTEVTRDHVHGLIPHAYFD